MRGQSRCRGEILGEAILDGERAQERLHDALVLGLATGAKERIQLRQIGHPRHRGGKATLDRLDGGFGVRLLIPTPGHAELGFERVVSGQGLVAGMKLALPPPEIAWPRSWANRHTSWDLARTERTDHAFEDGLGALKRYAAKGALSRPGCHEERNELAAVGKVDVMRRS